MKVLHVLYQSLPSVFGSTIRSRDLLWAQHRAGLSPHVISSPFQEGAETDQGWETVEGIPHYRTFIGKDRFAPSDREKGLRVRLTRMASLFSFQREVARVASELNPAIIHVHAMFYCAWAAAPAARRLGVPLVYEVRSRWEKMPHLNRSLVSRLTNPLVSQAEVQTMRAVHHVIAINRALADDVAREGVSVEKITVVGNAVRVEGQESPRFDFPAGVGPRFGYIGSLTELEGLELLLDAWLQVQGRLPNASLDIYGGGPALDGLRARANSGTLERVTVHGPIRPKSVPDAFEDLDVVVLPRRRTYVSDTVTPLKPLEAMRWGKLVVASDVGGMRELVADGETGLLFPAGDTNALARVMIGVADTSSRARIMAIRERGFRYVLDERNWITNGRAYRDLYRRLAAG